MTADLDVEAILADLGIQILGYTHSRKKGPQAYALCPHHHAVYDKGRLVSTQQDHNPAWYISLETGMHLCWSCGFKGSLERLVRIKGGDPSNLDEMRRDARREALRNRDAFAGERPAEVLPMTEARINMYDPMPPAWARDKRNVTPEACETFGIRWDSKQEAWILPIRHPDSGKLMGYQAKGEGNRYFRNKPADVMKSLTLFGIDVVPQGGEVIVVESPLDAVYLWTLGRSAVSTMGVHVSVEQMTLLIRRWDRLVLALDNDTAGWKETYRLLGRWYPSGKTNRNEQDYSRRIQIRVFNYSAAREKCKDPGEMSAGDVGRGLLNALSPLMLRKAA